MRSGARIGACHSGGYWATGGDRRRAWGIGLDAGDLTAGVKRIETELDQPYQTSEMLSPC